MVKIKSFVLAAVLSLLCTSELLAHPMAGEVRKLDGMEFVYVPAGTIDMGCLSWFFGCGGEQAGREVQLNGYWLGKTEITQQQWKAVMGMNPSKSASCGDDCPVDQVSWNDVQGFIQRLNAGGEGKYRLPTEAEWEYACRSGGYPEKYCGGRDVDRVAWHTVNSKNKGLPVGQKDPNGLGIYDMNGNVWEWTCSDWGQYEDGQANHAKCSSGGHYRVIRGGSWYNDTPAFVKSVSRHYNQPDYRYNNLGFRLVLVTIP